MLMDLLGSGIALHEQTIADALDVARFTGLTDEDIEDVRNKEVKAALYQSMGVVPENPVEFLRYLVYKATNKTLLIKSLASVAASRALDAVPRDDSWPAQASGSEPGGSSCWRLPNSSAQTVGGCVPGPWATTDPV